MTLRFSKKRPRRPLAFEALEARAVLTATPLLDWTPLDLTSGRAVAAQPAPLDYDSYAIDLNQSGRLRVQVDAVGVDARLSLFDAEGRVLAQSDGRIGQPLVDAIEQHLTGTRFYIGVEAIDAGSGSYTLTVDFTPATPPHRPLPVGDGPYEIETVDLDADGHLDLVAQNYNSNDLSVLYGLGDGTFGREQRLPGQLNPWLGLAFGDFDGDGRTDLASSSFNGGNIQILLQRAGGGFDVGAILDGVAGSMDLEAGDIDGDGCLDLAAAAQAANEIVLFRGAGDGTFAQAGTLAAGALPTNGILADLDGDGHLDLAVTNSGGNDISVFYGRGDLTFGTENRFSVGSQPYDLAAADFDRDGRVDVVVSNGLSGDVSVLYGRPAGFEEQVRIVVGDTLTTIVVDDFTGDGWVDVAVGRAAGGTVHVLRNPAESLRFLRGLEAITSFAGANVDALTSGDFDRDGRSDLAVVDGDDGTVTILRGAGTGAFPGQDPVGAAKGPWEIAAGDLNNDGVIDVVVPNFNANDVAVFFGRGDGSFREMGSYAVGSSPAAPVLCDLDDDGWLDVIVANSTGNSLSILFGQGRGLLAPSREIATGDAPYSISVGDMDEDGDFDLVAANYGSNDFSIFFNSGDGSFTAESRFNSGGSNLYGTLLRDFNGDGHLDLAGANFGSNDISIRLGRGDGTFVEEVRYGVGASPMQLAAGDWNGDGRVDLAVSNYADGTASILWGDATGTFVAGPTYSVGEGPAHVLAGDFNGDGNLDLATENYFSHDVAVLINRGSGVFAAATFYATGESPTGSVLADVNGDGRLDLLAANYSTNDISAHLGLGDGTFQPARRTQVADSYSDLVEGDFNGDGQLDLATANVATGTIAIHLGQGTGGFKVQPAIEIGGAPVALAVGDFNRDGRLDLAVADELHGRARLLLGLGDGNFNQPLDFGVGLLPVDLVAGDFNDDRYLDLAVADYDSGQVAVLLGQAGSTFAAPISFAAGTQPSSIIAGDFDNDGRLDLGIGAEGSQEIVVALGQGDGRFAPRVRKPIEVHVTALVSGDFNDDGRLDLATFDAVSPWLYVALGTGTGDFAPWHRIEIHVAGGASTLAVADFNRDGRLDIACAGYESGTVAVLLGHGDGTFAQAAQFDVGPYLVALVVNDSNDDGLADLAGVLQASGKIVVRLGLGNGALEDPGVTSLPIRSTPLVADFNGDGALDNVILRRDGKILYREGRIREPGTYKAPVVLNPNLVASARDLRLLREGNSLYLVALSAQDPHLDVYAFVAGEFHQVSNPGTTGPLASRIALGDLNGDPLADVAVLLAGQEYVLAFFQTAAGPADAQGFVIPVGAHSSDISLVDVDGLHGLDIVVSDRESGEVRAILNDPAHPFQEIRVYRAGTGIYGQTDSGAVQGNAGTDSFVAADFDGDSAADLLVLNAEWNQVAWMKNSGHGGWLNPEANFALPTGADPTALVTGDFNRDGRLDFAVLNRGDKNLSVYLGDGRGGFEIVAGARPATGHLPSGLTVHDVDADGQLDLLVGSEWGDVLTLLGRGDGTFQHYQRAGRGVALAVTDLDGDGRKDFILGSEALDRVSVQYSTTGTPTSWGADDGLLAPSALVVADVDRDAIDDLIVANGGGNHVVVFRGLGNGQFGTGKTYFVGTNPVALAVNDLNGDSVLDLIVTNQGSNDVSILLGSFGSGGWGFSAGPRLAVDAGPVATAVADVTGDGLADLVVSSAGAKTLGLLEGVGNGFFDDRNRTALALPHTPGQVFVGHFDAIAGVDAVVLNRQSDSLTFFSGFQNGVVVAAGGFDPNLGLAGDFNGDGFTDLVVAHHDAGTMALFLGGDRFLFAGIASTGGLYHPTGLALGEIGSGYVQIFAAGEGAEVASLTFFLDLTPVLPPSPGTDASGSAGSTPLQFSALASNSLGIVPILTDLLPANQSQAMLSKTPEQGESDVAFAIDSASVGAGREVEAVLEAQPLEPSTTRLFLIPEPSALNDFVIGAEDPLEALQPSDEGETEIDVVTAACGIAFAETDRDERTFSANAKPRAAVPTPVDARALDAVFALLGGALAYPQFTRSDQPTKRILSRRTDAR